MRRTVRACVPLHSLPPHPPPPPPSQAPLLPADNHLLKHTVSFPPPQTNTHTHTHTHIYTHTHPYIHTHTHTHTRQEYLRNKVLEGVHNPRWLGFLVVGEHARYHHHWCQHNTQVQLHIQRQRLQFHVYGMHRYGDFYTTYMKPSHAELEIQRLGSKNYQAVKIKIQRLEFDD